MRFYRERWFYFGGVYFVILSFVLGLWGGGIPSIQRILLYSFMALLVHQFEEYALPGGFPAAYNMALSGEREHPERVPLNTLSSFVVNVALGYSFYLLAALFPNLIWLGLAQVLFGMAQVFVHGVILNVKLRRFYNPGMASVFLLHFPIGIFYIWYVTAHGFARPIDFLIGAGVTIAAALLIIALPIHALNDPNSKYPFPEADMLRFHVKDKLQKAGLW